MKVYDPVLALCRIDTREVLRETPKFYVFKEPWGGGEYRERKTPGRPPFATYAEAREWIIQYAKAELRTWRKQESFSFLATARRLPKEEPNKNESI